MRSAGHRRIDGMTRRAFAKPREHVGMDVGVEDHEVGVGEDVGGAHREEPRVPAACTDERDLAPAHR